VPGLPALGPLAPAAARNDDRPGVAERRLGDLVLEVAVTRPQPRQLDFVLTDGQVVAVRERSLRPRLKLGRFRHNRALLGFDFCLSQCACHAAIRKPTAMVAGTKALASSRSTHEVRVVGCMLSTRVSPTLCHI